MKVLYTKYSSQRRKKFRISTSIIEDNGENYVVKRPLYPEGKMHMKNMLEKYAEEKKKLTQIGWDIVQGELYENGEVRFPYVKGERLEDVIEHFVELNDYESAVKIILNFNKSILESSYILDFQFNSGFQKIFGNLTLDDYHLHAFDLSNIDMVYSNFIVNDSNYILIDYEWIFDFQIPIEFILYRSLFHNMSFQKMPKEYQDRVYNQLHIDKELSNIFSKMELLFQDYVKGNENDLRLIYNQIGNKTKTIEELEYGINTFRIKIENQVIVQKQTLQSEIKIEQNISGLEGNIELQLNTCNGIYKIIYAIGIKKGQEVSLNMKTGNYGLNIIDDYYFSESFPKIVFNNEGYDELKIYYRIIEKNNLLMDNIINALNEKNAIEIEKQQYEEYKNAYDKCSQLLSDCQEAFETVSKELDEIKSKFWWKLDEKLARLLKRGKK